MGIVISFSYILCQFKFSLELGSNGGKMMEEIGSSGNIGGMDGKNGERRMKPEVGIKWSSMCCIMNKVVVLELCKTDPLYPIILLIGAEIPKVLFNTLVYVFCLGVSLGVKSS